MMRIIPTLLMIAISTCLAVAQSLPLTGVQNARQLGGIAIGDKHVRDNMLLRTANLSAASDEDLAVLHDTYRVAQVFDFRSTLEYESLPDRVIDDCEYIWLPCLDKAVKEFGPGTDGTAPRPTVSRIGEAILQYLDAPQVKQMADSLYPMIVFDRAVQQHYATFLRTLAALPEGRAALWHCTQGKDRAGCASAFVLAALGADRQTIVEDFARSNIAYQPLIDRLIAKADEKGCDEEQKNIIYALVGVSVISFERTLDAIDDRYGSLDNYLTEALGCDAALREKLRSIFLK